MQTCDYCGVYFEPVSNSAGKFCAQNCYKMSRTKKVSKVCEVCGNVFEVHKRRDKTARYCTWECKQTVSGDKHPHWKGGARAGWYRREYGISLEQYDQMYDDQGGKCAICGTSTPGGVRNRFHLDHCHFTGKIRGLLCHKCNNGLGYFNDDPIVLLEAFRYLHEYSTHFQHREITMSHDTYPADVSVHKSTLIVWGRKLMQAFADTIEDKYDGWEDDLVTLSNKIGDIITKEPVTGV